MQAIADLIGIPVADLLALLAAGVALLVMVAIYRTALVHDPMKGRMKALDGRRDALRSGLLTTRKRQSNIKRVDSVGAMRALANRLKLLQTEQSRKITLQLTQAGYRDKDALVIYQVARLALPFLMGIVGVILFYGIGALPNLANFHTLMAGGMVLIGFKLPDIFLKNAKDKRIEAIRKGLPDALDLLVVCAEAGLSLDSALNRVSRELGRSSPELADEFELTSIELNFLPERRQALLNLSERVDLQSLRGVVTALVQSERYGTPLAMALRVLSNEFRNERLLRAEEKAARLPATLTVPLIVFIMPVLFIVLIGPAACKVSDEFISKN